MGSVPAARDKRSGVTGGPQTFRSPTAVIVWWVWVLFAVANLIDLAVQGRDHASLVAAAILVMATGVAYVCAQRPRILADRAGVTVVNPLRDHHAGWANVTKVDLADLVRVHCQQGPGRTKVIYAWAVHYSRRRKLVAQAKASRQSARMSSGRPSFGLGGYGGSRLPGLGGTGYGGTGYGGTGYGRSSAAEPASAGEADAERIVGLLNEYVTAARAETIYADGTEPASSAAAPPGPAPGPAPEAGSPPAAPPEPPPASPPNAASPNAAWLEPLRSTWSGPAVLALLAPALLLLLAIFT